MPAQTGNRSRAPAVRPAEREPPRRAALVWGALALPLIAMLCFIMAGGFDTSAPRGPQGLFDVVDGRPYPATPASGRLTLLSFLATQPDTASTASRKQAVVLTSLSVQYHNSGLNVAIVDESPLSPRPQTLTNTAYDWQLGAVAMLEDPGGRAAEHYGVTGTPTTFLIGPTGAILAHWTGYVLTATATAAITAHLTQGPRS